jgi:NIPSNAP protein
MRNYQLRVYTLSSAEALDRYRTVHYPRHLSSFPKFDIGLHGLWTDSAGEPKLYVLLSFPADRDLAEITERYLASPELRSDMEGFDTTAIVAVTTTQLTPSPGSPLL